jgi:hypothetical protein
LNRSLSIMYPRLLTEANLNSLKDKFNEHVEHVLEEAIRKHVRNPNNSINTLFVAQYPSHYYPMVDVLALSLLRLRQHPFMALFSIPLLPFNVDRWRFSYAVLDGNGSSDWTNRATDH